MYLRPWLENGKLCAFNYATENDKNTSWAGWLQPVLTSSSELPVPSQLLWLTAEAYGGAQHMPLLTWEGACLGHLGGCSP